MIELILISCVITAIICFFIGYLICKLRNNSNLNNFNGLIQNHVNSVDYFNILPQLTIETINNEQISGVNSFQNLVVTQTNQQYLQPKRKRLKLKQIRRRKKAIRQFKLIRIKKIKLYHTLKKINKQKEKQIYINEKQKQIKLYNKNLKRENKNIKLENINVIKDTNKIINTEIKVFNNMIKLMSENIDCKPANQDPAIPAIDNM